MFAGLSLYADYTDEDRTMVCLDERIKTQCQSKRDRASLREQTVMPYRQLVVRASSLQFGKIRTQPP